MGGTETREHRSPNLESVTLEGHERHCSDGEKCGPSMFLPVCKLGQHYRRRSVPPGVAVGAAVAAEQSGQWGVSDPHLAAPFFAPRPARRGSLTPHMHVTIIRRDGATSVTPANAARVERVRTSFALVARA